MNSIEFCRNKIDKLLGNFERNWKNCWNNRGVKVTNGQKVCEKLERMHGKTKILLQDKLSTKMKMKKSYARVSSMLENYYENELEKGKYSEKHMLAIINPYRQAPLTALLLFTTKEELAVRIRLKEDRSEWMLTEYTRRHRVPVFFLHAGKKNTIILQLLDKEEQIKFERELHLFVSPLPSSLESMVKIDKKEHESVSPMTLVFGGDTKYPYMFDKNGEIRYYLNRRPKSYGIFTLSNNRFLFLSRDVCAPSFANPHSVLCQEMDYFGRVYHEYYIPEGLHHDACEMTPGGNLLTASSSMKQWVEDTVIEIDRNTGNVVKTLCMEDVLKEHEYFDYFDWAHVNTVSYNEEDNSILVCMRNLHTVIKVDWETNELIWILCDGEFWKGTPYEKKVLKPEGDISFFYQPHAAYFLPKSENEEKRMIIYDNHTDARRPVKNFDNDKKSYVKIYVLDEKAFSVRQEHQYETEKSTIRSNGIYQDGRILAMSGCLQTKKEGYGGQIEEFDYEQENVLTRYLLRSNFYRAYPFSIDYKALAMPIQKPDEYVIGEQLRGWKSCEGIELKRATEKNNWKMDFYEELLCIYCRDHEITKVWIKGDDKTYVMDYSETEQKIPSKFGAFTYYIAMPVSCLKPDKYEVYVQGESGEIFNTKNQFVKKRMAADLKSIAAIVSIC